MLNVSSAFKQALADDWRNYIFSATITLKDNTVLSVTKADLTASGNTVEDGLCTDTAFGALGACPIGSCTLTLNNTDGTYSNYDFTGARVVLTLGLIYTVGTTETTETIQRGVYFVDEPKYTATSVALYCLDNMYRLDYPYDSNLVYPATLATIVNDICTKFNLTLATQNFPQKDFIVDISPVDGTVTYREVLSWCAEIAGCWVRCNTVGSIVFGWYNQQVLEDYYDDGDTSGMIDLHSISEQDIGLDDIIITGVTMSIETTTTRQATTVVGTTTVTYNETVPTTTTYTYGTADYAVQLNARNKFITTTNAQSIVDRIGAQITGIRYRRAVVSHLSLPYIQAGDIALLTDRKGNEYVMLLTRTLFTVGSYQQTASAGQTVLRNVSTQYSNLVKEHSAARQEVFKETQSREKAIAELGARIVESASGLYTTQVESPVGSGSYIYYCHNKPVLAESDIQIQISTIGVTVTANGTDPNPTWYGLTVDGELIASILNTRGVNADWINTGQLRVTKTVGSTEVEMLFVDCDTGTVRISDQVPAIDDARKVATNYLTYDANTGLDVGYNGTSAKTRITGGGVEIFDANNESSAQFGTDVRIGKSDNAHILFDEDTQTFFDKDQVEIGKLGVQDDAIMDITNKILTVQKEQSTNIITLNPAPILQTTSTEYLVYDNVTYYPLFDLYAYVDSIQDPTEYVTYAGGSKIYMSEDGDIILKSSADPNNPTFDLYDDGDVWSTISSVVSVEYDNADSELTVTVTPQTSGTYYYFFFVKYVAEDKAPYFKFGPEDSTHTSGYDYMGAMSFASGQNTWASGMFSHAFNRDTLATGKYQTVIGTNNKPSEWFAFIIGNGTRGNELDEIPESRSNAFTVNWAGGINAGINNQENGTLTPDHDDIQYADVQNLIGKGLALLRDVTDAYELSSCNYTIIGQYNKTAVDSNYYAIDNSPIFVIGGGDNDTTRSNIIEVYLKNIVLHKPLTASNGISFPNSTAASSLSNPDYFITMDSFSDGGRLHYTRTVDLFPSVSVKQTSGDVNVSSGTDTTLCNTGSLAVGTYLFTIKANFAANGSGRRVAYIAKSSTSSAPNRYTRVQYAPAPSGATEVSFSYIAQITSAETWYLRVYQNSGSTLACGGGIQIIRISPTH